jgi:glycosyltransferase involved in cell wall biosynthesis
VHVVRDDVHLLVIGDGPLRQRLEKYARQVHVDDRVHFLGHRADVPRILPHCDLLWLASEYEGLPNVVMEAMAAGLPVVASDIPGNRDLIVPETTGYLVPVGDRAGFARHAVEILSRPELAQALGAAGRKRIETEFTVGQMVARHAELYRRLLG